VLTPEAVEVDEYGAAKGLRWARRASTQPGKAGTAPANMVLPARTILVAAGTQPNTVLAREDDTTSCSMAAISRPWMKTARPVKPERVAKPSKVCADVAAPGRPRHQFLRRPASQLRSSGNVVKAMASAKAGLSGGLAHSGARAASEPRPPLCWRDSTTSCAPWCTMWFG
jgi:hypothetical protein